MRENGETVHDCVFLPVWLWNQGDELYQVESGAWYAQYQAAACTPSTSHGGENAARLTASSSIAPPHTCTPLKSNKNKKPFNHLTILPRPSKHENTQKTCQDNELTQQKDFKGSSVKPTKKQRTSTLKRSLSKRGEMKKKRTHRGRDRHKRR
jgi:hypothetical protein